MTPEQERAAKLAAQIKSKLAGADSVVKTAEREGRSLTDAEQRFVGDVLKEVEPLQAAFEKANGEAKLWQQVKDTVGAIDDGSGRSGSRGGPFSASVVKALEARGQKALTTGSVTVPSEGLAVVRDPDRPRSLFDVIPVERLDGADQFTFLRETVHTNLAAPVATGATKPTSIFTVEKQTGTVRTIAHLSEPIDNATLADVKHLRRYLDEVMRTGVELALESQIVNGTGVAPQLPGILADADTQPQAWDTDILKTTREALTLLQVANFAGGSYALNPADWERVDLARLAAFAAGGDSSPVDTARQQLWSQRVIVTTAVPAGVGLLFDRDSVQLWLRESVRIDVSDADGGFEANQVRLRAELRAGFAVLRPRGIVEIDLTP